MNALWRVFLFVLVVSSLVFIALFGRLPALRSVIQVSKRV